MKNHIAIIPARGGSKRIPRKNIVDFMGKPMIAHTIEAAKETNCFSQVFVDTDDEEIAEVSRAYGAEVPFLRQSETDDFIAVSETTAVFCERLSFEDLSQIVVTQLFAVTPLRTKQDIIEFNRKFVQGNFETLLSCSECSWPNPYWSGRISATGEMYWLFPESLNVRSQDLPKLFVPSGAIWMSQLETLMQERSFYHAKTRFLPIRVPAALDIDTFDDLRLAQALGNVSAQRINEKDSSEDKSFMHK